MNCSVYFMFLINLFLIKTNHYCCANSFMTIEETACLLEKLGYSRKIISSSLSQCSINSSLGYSEQSELPVHLDEASNLIDEFDKLPTSTSSNGIKDLKNEKKNRAKNKSEKIFPRNCYELQKIGDNKSGLKTVYEDSTAAHPFQVYCNQDTDGGGWTVIQRRINLPIRENFNRTFREYQIGFGNMSGEFWIGLDKMHHMTKTFFTEIRIDMDDFDGNSEYAKFGFFYVNNDVENYKLNIGHFEGGDAGDSLSEHNNIRFSAPDLDLDGNFDTSCSVLYQSGFWFKSCFRANFNGPPSKIAEIANSDGIVYYTFKGWVYSLKKVEMKIRPKFAYEFPPYSN